jgi:ArsR family transcriptional regulator, arsenate/arsenite/antimonite-responsive transcriptional repressor
MELVEPDQFNRITRALADPTRMEILQRIAGDKEVACAALAGESAVSQPTISHHLKELSTAGLVKSRRVAKFYFYSLDRKLWAAYLAEMRRRVPVGLPKTLNPAVPSRIR